MESVFSQPAVSVRQRRAARFAWLVLPLTLLVIAWGAFVRATGSGAGCGEHWPLCNGQVLPRAKEIATLIEFSHRASSGLSMLLVFAVAYAVWKAFPAGHRARKAALWSVGFIIVEALIGAALVLLRLVANNASLTRAFSHSAHLLNTLLLLGAMTLTAWWASGRPAIRLSGQRTFAWILGIALGGMMLVAMTGGIAALGDTLFPSTSLASGLQQDFSPTAHLLLRLRVLHPILAVTVGLLTIMAAVFVSVGRPGPVTNRLSTAIVGLVVGQLTLGALNLYLLAPVWLQLVHLVIADVVWIALVLLSAQVLSSEPQPVAMRQAELAATRG